MGWVLLGGFFAYWFLLKHGTVAQLIDPIRNELSTFSTTPAAGLAQGSVSDPGTHAGSPGIVSVPLGGTSATPSQMEWSQADIPVNATTPIMGGIRVGTLGPRNDLIRVGLFPGVR